MKILDLDNIEIYKPEKFLFKSWCIEAKKR
jgi:hypothetical protein